MNTTASGDFPKLKIKAFAEIQERETPEARFWKSFSITKEEQLQGAASCIHFNPITSHREYIVTNSTKVSLYNSVDDKVQRSYSRFSDDAYSGRYRRDGKLIVAGDKAGNMKVFDVKTKAVLRQVKAHSAAVRATTWSCDGLFMLSGSDDKKVKRWDLGTSECVWEAGSHGDYIRTIDCNPTITDIFITGSYDHVVKVWDSRVKGSLGAVQNIQHDNPVEVCMMSPSGAILLTASSNEVKLWDMISGGKCIHTFINHQKNVTGLSVDSNMNRMLSCGLDGHVKIYNMQTLEVSHGIKYGAPLLSVGLSPDGKKLVVGHTDGKLIFRNIRKGPGDSEIEDLEDGIAVAAKTSSSVSIKRKQERFYKGAGAGAIESGTSSADGLIETDRQARLRPYEQHLKKFNYQLALDCALRTRNPLVAVTVLEELCRRSGLTIALSGRDENSLEPLISFCAKYISNPRFASLIVQVVERILDLYSSVLGHSDAIDELFLKLHKQVKTEVVFHKQVMKVMGSIDCVVNSSALARR